MPDLITPTASAVLAHLAADTAVQSLLGNPARIYDHRPAQATFPFAVLAQLDGREAGAKSLIAQSLLITLQVFSRQRSGSECRQILGDFRDALHNASLTISGGALARCQEEFVSVAFDEDSGGTQGLVRYRLVVSV